jgi:hypothetical protein
MICPKCGQSKFFFEYCEKGVPGFFSCYDCHHRESMTHIIGRQAITINALKKNLETTEAELSGVMKDAERQQERLKEAEEIITRIPLQQCSEDESEIDFMVDVYRKKWGGV